MLQQIFVLKEKQHPRIFLTPSHSRLCHTALVEFLQLFMDHTIPAYVFCMYVAGFRPLYKCKNFRSFLIEDSMVLCDVQGSKSRRTTFFSIFQWKNERCYHHFLLQSRMCNKRYQGSSPTNNSLTDSSPTDISPNEQFADRTDRRQDSSPTGTVINCSTPNLSNSSVVITTISIVSKVLHTGNMFKLRKLLQYDICICIKMEVYLKFIKKNISKRVSLKVGL